MQCRHCSMLSIFLVLGAPMLPVSASYFKLDIFFEMFSQPQKMMIAYLGSWLIHKAKICTECMTSLTDSNKCNSSHLFIDAKSYTDTYKGLLRPCPEIVDLVHSMECIFRYQFDNVICKPGVASILISEMKEKCDVSFLFRLHQEHALHLSEKLIDYFVVMRIFYAIKFKNQKNVKPKTCMKKLNILMHV